MNIWCQLPLEFDEADQKIKKFYDRIHDVFDMVKLEKTEVHLASLNRGIRSLQWLQYPGLRFLNEREIVRNALRGVAKEYDGIIIANYFDAGLRTVRQLSPIPVVGFAEAAMLFAAKVGGKFAVITADEKFVPDFEMTINSYGLRSRAIEVKPVRPLSVKGQDMMGYLLGDYLLISDFEDLVRTCIADGADVVIAGGGLFSVMLTQAGIREIDRVPILDPFVISLKTCEMMIALHAAGVPVVSRRSVYYTPNQDTSAEALSYFFDTDHNGGSQLKTVKDTFQGG